MSLQLPTGYSHVALSKRDAEIASIAFGCILGFGFLLVWRVIKQTSRITLRQKWRSLYVWLIWIELASNLLLGVLGWCLVKKIIQPGFGFYFVIYLLWLLEIQCQTQIICSRLQIIQSDQWKSKRIRWGLFGFFLAIAIAVSCIWIPAMMQVSNTYAHINDVTDRVQKSIYLVVDAWLNWYFIKTVRKRLVQNGLSKYERLARFNMRIMILSIVMDVMIIALSKYVLFIIVQALAFLVKLNIELTMADLIASIARESDLSPPGLLDETGFLRRNNSATSRVLCTVCGWNPSSRSAGGRKNTSFRMSYGRSELGSDKSQLSSIEEKVSGKNLGKALEVLRTCEVEIDVEDNVKETNEVEMRERREEWVKMPQSLQPVKKRSLGNISFVSAGSAACSSANMSSASLERLERIQSTGV